MSPPLTPIPSTNPRRLWFQFSLRTMMIAMFLFGCGFGWITNHRRESRQQLMVAKKLRSMGAVLSLDPEPMIEVDDWPKRDIKTSTHPEWLRAILGDASGRNVKSLQFSAQSFRVGALGYPKEIDPEFAPLLPELSKLETLTINCAVAPEFVFETIPRLQHLKILGICWCEFDDKHFVHLENLKQLRTLFVQGTPLSDEVMARIATISHLKTLDLQDARFSSEGLKHLAKLKELHTLNLARTQISDGHLVSIKTIPHLRTLDLSYNGVTDDAIGELNTALPNLKVLRNTKIRYPAE